MIRKWMVRVGIGILLGVSVKVGGHAQTTGLSAETRTQLRERYDVVILQEGVALVPRQTGSEVRFIQIVDGVVTVDGDLLTGRQLRDRLGPDADLVLQVSYLDPQQQRDLAGAGPEPSSSPATVPEPRAAEEIERTDITRGDVVRFGGPVTIGRNERVQGDVVAIGGPVDIQGEVTGDVSAIGGPITLGPQAVVRGDVHVIGGGLNRAPGARILGRIDEVGGGGSGTFNRGWMWSNMFGPWWSRLGSLAATVMRLIFLVLLGLIAVAFALNPIERIAARSAVGPVRAGLIGLLAEILFLPVLILLVVVLAVSIVGIPLLALVPFAILLVILLMLVGFIGLAYQVGQRLAARFGWVSRGAYVTVAIGIVAIGGLTLIAKLAGLAGGFLLGAPLTALGYFVEYVAWTIGFGATILAWYESQTRFGHRKGTVTPPPLTPTPGEV
jgi:hypothetical protein